VSFNTLTTPRGVQYRLVLPDGTAVWLNTGTSLRYPVAFTGKERKVMLTGEAYFEVKHDSKKPFRIQAGNQLIEDLGTNFNIKAYADEPVMKTTLLEGAVKVGNTILKPGEQAQVNEKGDIAVAKNINVADVMAWKNGFFVFRNDNLKTVMREIARWYDVEVIYQPNVNNNQQFSGKIDRGLTLTQVLNGLALTKARFTITDNREVVILP
jgi:ferric-dicitrate binding protein FerR (iron transport regulator)